MVNDVHLWEAVNGCSPRMLIIKVNNRLPFEQPHFAGHTRGAFRQEDGSLGGVPGSSLASVVASAEGRGYVFIGMNTTLG